MTTVSYFLGAFWTLVVIVECWVLAFLVAALETWQ
jgi:hypothetical protein